MLRGDELMRKRELFLYHLYEQGAIAPNSAMNAVVLQGEVGVNDQDFESLYLSLHGAGLVRGRPSGILYLTDLGLREASAIVQAVRNTAEQASTRPIGFSLPNKNE
ncbi:MAG: hypothetical protein H8E40_14950 [Chloroflexi bacterium]|nr:hypothetical protein [Chloroflexota bacterium]